jgi:RNA polymerase sigma-70 factor (ECF subfamily)
MRRIALRDRAAFAELYKATSAKLLGVALRIVRERALAEDILHEVFIRIWERAASYDPERGSPLAWITIMARNRALDEVRSRTRLKSSHDTPELDEIPSENEHPLDKRMHEEDRALLMRCLEKLEQPRREMVLLAYQNGLSREDLAQRFGAPVATIKTWLRRGLENLRLCLTAHG